LDFILGLVIIVVAGVTILLFAYNMVRELWQWLYFGYKSMQRIYCRRYIRLAESIIAKYDPADLSQIGDLPQALNYYEKVCRVSGNFRYRDRLEYVKSALEDRHEFGVAMQDFAQARNLAQQSIGADKGNPFDLSHLNAAIASYRQGIGLLGVYQMPTIEQEIDRNHHDIAQIQIELDRRGEFRQIFDRGEENFQQQYYQLAIDSFLVAQKLYSPPLLESRIAACKSAFDREVKYLQQISNARNLARNGKFHQARTDLDRVSVDFWRADGEELRQKIDLAITSREKFQAGTVAESEGNLALAREYYLEAIALTPELAVAKLRLAIVDIAAGEWQAALSRLETVAAEGADYIRGYIYSRQGKWQLARQAWQQIDRPAVKEQIEKLSKLAVRNRAEIVEKIGDLVEIGQLETAGNVSQEFISRWGRDPVIQNNLERHIVPRLQTAIWQEKDWQQLASTSKLDWLRDRHIDALHNWAVASYYLARSEDRHLAQTIVAWANAIPHLTADRSIQDIPWLAGNSLSPEDFGESLTKILSEQIERVKERDLELYLELRDLYRQEMQAFKTYFDRVELYLEEDKIKLSPEAYFSCKKVRAIDLNMAYLWKTLYTEWGRSVAACLDGDPLRAVAIQPESTRNAIEEMARDFVNYSHGAYYLEQHQWREAIAPLSQIQDLAIEYREWAKKIDKLCLKQQQWIEDRDEHLAFARFWYDLYPSDDARDYFLEYQVLYVDREWCENRLDDISALRQLEQLKQLDPERELTYRIIEKIQVYLDRI
jgi:hypothetical protein